MSFPPNFISVARAGRAHIIGPGASSGLTAVGGNTLNAPATAKGGGREAVHHHVARWRHTTQCRGRRGLWAVPHKQRRRRLRRKPDRRGSVHYVLSRIEAASSVPQVQTKALRRRAVALQDLRINQHKRVAPAKASIDTSTTIPCAMGTPPAFFSIDGGTSDLEGFNKCTNSGEYGGWIMHSPRRIYQLQRHSFLDHLSRSAGS
jgi:hypothetical protein